MKKTGLVTSDEVYDACVRADFGGASNKDVLRYGLLKCVCGFYQGQTSTLILQRMGLITAKYNITARGRENLYEWFKGESTV